MSLLPLIPQHAAVPFAARLGDFGDRVALVTAEGELSYSDLAARVAERTRDLGPHRRLVLLTGGNDLDTVVTYLAALAAGHPVLLAPGGNPAHLADIVEVYDPDVVCSFPDASAGAAGTAALDERRRVSAHDLHPDLALLLTTSGSTGAPKLARLSHDNLQSNAQAIAEYLGIRSTDRAVTTLPLHYCYGLSVLNSHLACGASVVLTDLSVVDACFWDLVRDRQVTSFAGVPYTFELLDRVGFDRMSLPRLRYLTQAGGRMPPARVRRFAELGQRQGWDLFVMYGQTEATARMAYLPPDLAAIRPEAIGVPVPGGAFRIVPYDGRPDGAGELVYGGPNVMLGYAERVADLALGRVVHDLATGDVARKTDDGLYEIVGRRSRFVKVAGLRIDLDHLERRLEDRPAADGLSVACAGRDEQLIVAVEKSRSISGGQAHDQVRARVRELTGLPARSVHVSVMPRLPRTGRGKPDYAAVAELATAEHGHRAGTAADDRGVSDTSASEGHAGHGPVDVARLRALYGELLGRDDVTDDSTFVSLEGDSLSYVEVSLRLEQELGRLPEQWHTMSLHALAAGSATDRPERATGSRIRGRQVETNVVLRALAIVMIVGSHANVFALAGGAHVLLSLAGFNMARFHLTSNPRASRVRHLAASVARVAVPSIAWIAAVALVTRDYPWPTVTLLNGVFGPDVWTEPAWYFWFVEALVWSLVALTLVLAVPAVDRLDRRHPFWLAMGAVGLGLLPRFEVAGLGGAGDRIHAGLVVFWLFALGWAAAKASRPMHRVVVSVVAITATPGFFADAQREGIVVAGLLLLVWLPTLRVPRVLVPGLGILAASSLYIYLTHWQVYPHLEHRVPVLALLASLAVGIVAARVAGRATVGLAWLARLPSHDLLAGRLRPAVRRRGWHRHRDAVSTGAP